MNGPVAYREYFSKTDFSDRQTLAAAAPATWLDRILAAATHLTEAQRHRLAAVLVSGRVCVPGASGTDLDRRAGGRHAPGN